MRIGWYIHHHGGGHLARFQAVRPQLDAEVTCFSSLPEPASLPPATSWVRLEPDDDFGAGDVAGHSPTAGGLLHWAPTEHPPHTRRLAAIAAEVALRRLGTMVVDVSVEITLLARLLGTRPVVFTQPGVRDDAPHRLAFRAAERIIAPWPGEVIRPAHLEAFSEKVRFVGGISRFEGRQAVGRSASSVLVLAGAGGSGVSTVDVEAAARAVPDRDWRALGVPDPATGATLSWQADPWPVIASAATVVGFAGLNSIADLAVAQARAVIIPQDRPFGEQRHTARALGEAGLAVIEHAWPDADRWPGVLAQAAALEADWSRWRTSGAAARAAEVIAEVAAPVAAALHVE